VISDDITALLAGNQSYVVTSFKYKPSRDSTVVDQLVTGFTTTTNYTVLKDRAVGSITEGIVVDTEINVDTSYTDNDNAITGGIKAIIYDGLIPVQEEVILSNSQVVNFASLSPDTFYTIKLIAANYNRGDGNTQNFLLAERVITTLDVLNIELNTIAISNINTNNVTVNNATFSGSGLASIDSGSILFNNIVVPLSTNQINEIKAGQLSSALDYTGLVPDQDYVISFKFTNSNSAEIETVYRLPLADREFIT